MKLPIKVDYQTSTITRTDTGLSVRARPRVLDLVNILTDATAWASRETIAAKLGGWGDAVSDEAIRTHITMARHTLALLGARIVNKHGVGWRIEIGDEAGLPIVLPATMRHALSTMASAKNISIDEVVARCLTAALAGKEAA